MIINETAPKTPPKTTTPLLGEASAAPPAYAPRNAPNPVTQVPPAGPYVTYQPAGLVQRQTETARRRFIKALLVAVGIWLLASAFFGSIFTGRRTHRNLQAIGTMSGYPVPGGVDLHECTTEWTAGPYTPSSSTPYSSFTAFNFSLPSKALLLLSKGDLSAGHLRVSTGYKDQVEVKVTVHYNEEPVRDLAKVCLIKREENEGGVGIFTPRWRGGSRPWNYRLSFDVELVLPISKTSAQRFVNTLLTDVNNFSQDLEIWESFTFGNLTLQGSNGRIQSPGTLVAHEATLKTSNAKVEIRRLQSYAVSVQSTNGPITGTYETTGPLYLKTSNGKIDVGVTVKSEGDSESIPLTMITSNAALSAGIELRSSSRQGGTFPVKAQTSNHALALSFNELPIDATLSLDGKTSNSRANVSLPTTYEGKFSVVTSNAPADVQRRNKNEPDPKGAKRTRTLTFDSVSKTRTKGTVHWDKDNANRGDVAVRSSNGPVTLVL
uniref:Adhesin domain-containing protein n=1 Tax=Mycena chlorophos TaxID=658473 RepID=A0ABQ0LKI7_MYCCL|nr:predicted protein [Mycena chlorophos]